jgi:thioester reductase-like protein
MDFVADIEPCCRCERLPISQVTKAVSSNNDDLTKRSIAVDEYVEKFTTRLQLPPSVPTSSLDEPTRGHFVLVTGATGSLGAHLVSALVARPDVDVVFCLNRVSRGSEPEQRQLQSLVEKKLEMNPDHMRKLRVVQSHTSKHHMGLSDNEYHNLSRRVTVVIHNAWPMSGIRPIQGFEGQFAAMRNLIELACDAASFSRVVTFQFISSIAVVGHYPLWSGTAHVPEDRVGIESVLPNGYGDAKYVCERMLDVTLHKYPNNFRTMCVRLGQVAGSSKTGYWNSGEHLSFLIKSSQTLRALPDFKGELSWTPVDIVARTLIELALHNMAKSSATKHTYPIYHIDNPLRQSWEDMLPILARALDIPSKNRLPFTEWVRRVRRFPGSVENDNPAFKLIDFLDGNFLRMSCGGLLLRTEHTQEHSLTLAAQDAVSADIAEGYIRHWKQTGFLSG